MIIFLLFTAIYSLGNLYLLFKISTIFGLTFPEEFFLGLFILLMTLSPILTHQYSLKGPEKTSRIFLYISYLWMAFIVVFSPFAALLDSYNFIVRHAMLLSGRSPDPAAIPAPYTFFVPFLLSATFNIYGYFEAKRLKVEKLIVRTPKLPPGIDRITVAQVADLHLGIIVGDKTLNKVIKEIGDAKPDLIVSTGDLLDSMVQHIDHLSEKLKGISAPLGKFAVTGNHEFYGGLRHAVKFIEDSGFIMLRNSGVNARETINIAGVEDLGDTGDGLSDNIKNTPEREILASLPPGYFTILLKHRSEVDNQSLGLFDLQLSGHTHKGQIFPINLFTCFIFEHHTGFKNFEKGSALYVSRGAGTAGPPVRFLSPPELTIIEIVKE
jgi:predicted MPP superfamily phosphohydrolase